MKDLNIKKMTCNASIVLVGIALCLCSPLSGSLAAASPVGSPAANKLLFGIASNEAICPVKNIIIESRFVRSCVEANLPTGHLNLSVEDPERFLCLGVYDRIVTLCYLDSLNTGGKFVLPKNSTEFDNLVVKLPPTDKESFEFCKRPKNLYPPRYEQTKIYAEQLNKAMAMPGLCVKMCIYDDGKFNRLCSVIAAIEDIFLRIHSSGKSPKQETEDTAANEETVEHTVKAEGTVEKVIPEKAKEVAAKPEDKAVPQAGPSTDKEEANKNKKQSKPAQPQPQPEHTEPAPQITKPAVVPPPAALKESPRNEEGKKIEEPETPAKTLHPNTDVGSDKKADVQPPTSKNPPIVPDNLPISVEDSSDGYLKSTDNIGQSQDDPMNGEISEHTQEQENQDVGEETSEIGERNNQGTLEATLNKLEPPLPPNEQVEESPPLPSDKRELVPRMPSIRNDDDSHFFGYFTVIGVVCIAGYIGYHNKQKILAMVLEGRRSRGGRGRRRPSTANYRKLDCTLEEAVTSQCNSNVTHVIY